MKMQGYKRDEIFGGWVHYELYKTIEGQYLYKHYDVVTNKSIIAELDNQEKNNMTIEQFEEHMIKTVHELFDALEEGDLDERFDLHIQLNGKKIVLPMHADLYSRLEQFMKEEREENEQ